MNDWLEILKNFDYSELDSPENDESVIREEIILPLLKALGYDYKGRGKIVRGRKLHYPFIMIGTKKINNLIIPDYILECDGKCVCTIEAKAPSIDLDKEEYVGQAYSYAVHREVASRFFALCNGKEFRLYYTQSITPAFVFRMQSIESHFEKLNYYIGKDNVLENMQTKIAKDLGIHLKMKLCGDEQRVMTFFDLPISQIILVAPNTYTVDSSIILNEEKYCGSFDFTHEVLLQLASILPGDSLEKLSTDFTGTPVGVEFIGKILYVGIECKIGNKIYENINEQYMPLKVIKFLTACWR